MAKILSGYERESTKVEIIVMEQQENGMKEEVKEEKIEEKK